MPLPNRLQGPPGPLQPASNPPPGRRATLQWRSGAEADLPGKAVYPLAATLGKRAARSCPDLGTGAWECALPFFSGAAAAGPARGHGPAFARPGVR